MMVAIEYFDFADFPKISEQACLFNIPENIHMNYTEFPPIRNILKNYFIVGLDIVLQFGNFEIDLCMGKFIFLRYRC